MLIIICHLACCACPQISSAVHHAWMNDPVGLVALAPDQQPARASVLHDEWRPRGAVTFCRACLMQDRCILR